MTTNNSSKKEEGKTKSRGMKMKISQYTTLFIQPFQEDEDEE
jgi:hypothetical protein